MIQHSDDPVLLCILSDRRRWQSAEPCRRIHKETNLFHINVFSIFICLKIEKYLEHFSNGIKLKQRLENFQNLILIYLNLLLSNNFFF